MTVDEKKILAAMELVVAEPVLAAKAIADALVEIDTLAAEVERFKAWVADLQSGMFINCVYCGHRYGPDGSHAATVKDGLPMAEALKQHIAECPDHPMSKLAAEVEKLTKREERYSFSLKETVRAAEDAARAGERKKCANAHWIDLRQKSREIEDATRAEERALMECGHAMANLEDCVPYRPGFIHICRACADVAAEREAIRKAFCFCAEIKDEVEDDEMPCDSCTTIRARSGEGEG